MPISGSSSQPPASVQKPKKRKWTREQLLRNLEILGTLSAPLPPDLPPSPPVSRASSPTPGSKRKLDANSDTEHTKRPRTNGLYNQPSTQQQQQQQHHHHPSAHVRPSNPVYSMRSEPSEDGEVTEDAVVASTLRGVSSIDTSFVPVRRPRRGKPANAYFEQLHDTYHKFGRLLKYSGDRRFWSTYPSTHREYLPLLNPPPPNSPYHKFGGLIARLELIDALVCFTYSIWSRDYLRRHFAKDTWGTIEAFLSWCKHKWGAEDTVGDREKAFIGLIWMIEAFICGRKVTYQARGHVDAEMDKLVAQCKSLAAAAAAAAEENASAGPSGTSGPQSTPPMLPSPASIAASNSANSTPIGQANGTPNTTHSSSSSSSSSGSAARAQQQPPSLPPNLLPTTASGAPLSAEAAAAAAAVTVSITPTMAQTLKEQSGGIVAASFCMTCSQQTMTLPIMARYFPVTFARMVHSSLLPHEEHEPDIEDEEGELFWPGQCVTGEGLGWVCLMGKAMIKEFGKDIGYRGLDGVVPKPKPEEQGPETPASVDPSSSQAQTQSQPGGLAAQTAQTAGGSGER